MIGLLETDGEIAHGRPSRVQYKCEAALRPPSFEECVSLRHFLLHALRHERSGPNRTLVISRYGRRNQRSSHLSRSRRMVVGPDQLDMHLGHIFPPRRTERSWSSLIHYFILIGMRC